MNTSNNQRFLETETRIYECYLELLKNCPKELSVAGICRRTGLNRSSFYLHFQDFPDLREKAVQHYFVEGMLEKLKKEKAVFGDTPENVIGNTEDPLQRIRRYTESIFSYVQREQELFRLLWLDYQSVGVNNFSREQFEKIVVKMLENYGIRDKRVMQYIFDFFQAGFHAVLHRWLMNGCTEPPEFMAKLTVGCFPDGHF